MMHDMRHGIVFGTRTEPFLEEKSPSDKGENVRTGFEWSL